MKKLFVLAACALFMACSSSTESTEASADSSAAGTEATASSENAAEDSTVATAPDETAAAPAASSGSTGAATTAQPAAKSETAAAPAGGPSAKKGEALIATLDCMACHKIDTKLVGPAFTEVSKKYSNTAANAAMLGDKIIKGGKGNWGEIPMSPHPALSQEDAQSLAMYVLSIK